MSAFRLRAALAAALVAACAVAATAGDDAADHSVATQRAKARELAAKEDYDAAIVLLRAAQKEHAGDASIPLEMGSIFFARAIAERAGGLDDTLVRALLADASVQAKRALAIDASCTAATLLLARVADADGDADLARAIVRAWLETHPRDAAARFHMGDLCFAARDWEGADLAYTRGLEVDAANGLARLNQTEARQWLGIPKPDLEKGYLEAARLLPEADRPLRLLAGLHANDRDGKLAALGKVVEANPKAAWARVWIAYVLRKETPGDPARALAVLREAKAAAPGNPAVHVNLAEMSEEAGEVAEAVAEYTLAVECAPDNEMRAASNALDRILNGTQAGDGVPLALRERAYDAMVAKNPAEGAYGNNAGFWFRDVGKNYEKSLKYYLAAVRARPDDQDFLNDTALIYLFHLDDRRENCLPLFEKVLRLVEREGQPAARGYWDALENLSKYWFERGDFEKALSYAKRRIEGNAMLGGMPYPSSAAATWKRKAEAELSKRR